MLVWDGVGVLDRVGVEYWIVCSYAAEQSNREIRGVQTSCPLGLGTDETSDDLIDMLVMRRYARKWHYMSSAA